MTHKRIICHKAFLEGKTTDVIARETSHSPEAVDHYLLDFSRVYYATVLKGWTQIGSTVAFGPLTSALLTTDISTYTPLDAEISKLEMQLTEKRIQRDALALAIWEKVKRVRSSVRGIYGDDSVQYEHVGGTRMSEKKPRTRRVLTTE